MLSNTSTLRTPSTAHTRELPLAVDDLLAALLNLSSSRRLAILDSGAARGSCQDTRSADARYVIAGVDPFEIVEARGDELRITDRAGTLSITRGDVLALLDERLQAQQVALHEDLKRSTNENASPFAGACIATFAYEFVHQLERFTRASHHSHIAAMEEREPDVVLAFYETLVVHDYAQARTHAVGVGGRERVDALCDELLEAARDEKREEAKALSARPLSIAVSNFTRDDYIAAVRRIKEHIFAGDIYQANLTQQLTCALPLDLAPEEIFLRLRENHPAAFGAFIRRHDDTVISASPERFLRVWHDEGGRHIEARPIKGTRPRGRNATEDARLRTELVSSPKERAENVMIVDLMRNDIGRVCAYGSITVAELCHVEEHPTLFHLVSTVRGRLRDKVTTGDILRATFPCGSITGAPKIRAMEIIDELEPDPRNLSMGAIGYFSFDGSFDLNVAIRTMTVRDAPTKDARIARFNVGGGIVADSRPEDEYAETLVKARALLNALEVTMNERQ